MASNTAHEARPNEILLTTKQVSERYGIPCSTLRWHRSINSPDSPPSFSLSPRRVVYRLSECERWVAQREAATRKGGGAVE
ncbi:phage transcriptional regulator, AlpA [Segniliparus rotundus DSM 44985]|uniref:Phage transcriptional regulator, AlpA n=1 Tax=Segniliparus rotundus (strain ATCC BAA-972 / CDC 1076 / CIP 108378 / DSM 44985 / JCM 13578) TaxID=640132 RepID=D6ZE08_SEGRD|nr:transcriptional regulator [Segniliparus rotundus]ADG97288.1 phage transcriptional regulator, AlpA [Segniliparus rotundus DSM 44985]